MSVGDRGASNPKPTSSVFVIGDSDEAGYNLGGANPAVKLVGGKPEVKDLDVGDMGGSGGGAAVSMMTDTDQEALSKIKDLEEHEEDEIEGDHGEDCMCANCMAAIDPAVHKMHLKEYDAEDHYSKYGNVEYADKENHKYPIDTKAHAKAALSYINMPKNAKKYSGDKLSAIKSRIHAAAKKHGIEVADEKTKTMSANNPSFPDAYKAQPLQMDTENDTIIKNMNNTIIRKMAAEVGMEGESDEAKVLFAFLAKYEGLKAEIAEQITKKENTEGGGVGKTFSADLDFLKKEVEALKTQKVEDTNRNDQSERESLIRQAAREGKLVPLSADQVKTVNIDILRSIISNQPKNVVPLGSALRVLSVQGDNKPSREKAVQAFDQMIVK